VYLYASQYTFLHSGTFGRYAAAGEAKPFIVSGLKEMCRAEKEKRRERNRQDRNKQHFPAMNSLKSVPLVYVDFLVKEGLECLGHGRNLQRASLF
jgi:hypothetical protein